MPPRRYFQCRRKERSDCAHSPCFAPATTFHWGRRITQPKQRATYIESTHTINFSGANHAAASLGARRIGGGTRSSPLQLLALRNALELSLPAKTLYARDNNEIW